MSHSQSNENPTLSGVLAAYLQAVDAGESPNRDALLAAHPELADDLRAFFADHDRMNQAAAPLREDAEGDKATASSTDPNFPQPFGDYELLEEIGRGGMGIVYKARQVSLNRIVALKRIRAGQLASAEDIARFQREATASAGLDHPHIVPIYEVGEHGGQHYFTMKFIEGGNLNAHLLKYANDAKATAQVMSQIATAVHHAHQRGILHRDIKPGNTLIDAEGKAHVSDFGLAKQLEDDGKLTRSGAIVGTPEYMAPEQARGDKGLTTAADIYGIGAVLYYLLTRQPPFRGDYDWEILKQVVEDEPAAPRSVHRQANRDLETVCLKCLHKIPARRYGSAEELAQDLERCQRGETPLARRATLSERLRGWARKHPTRAALAVVLSLAALALFISGLYFNQRLQHEIDAVATVRADLETTGIALNQERKNVKATETRLAAAMADTDEEKKKASQVLSDFQMTRMVLQMHKAEEIREEDPFTAFKLLNDNQRCPVDQRNTAWHLLNNTLLLSAAKFVPDPLYRPEWQGHVLNAPWVLRSRDCRRQVRIYWFDETGVRAELVDPTTGKATLVRNWKREEGSVSAAVIHPDGKWLAVCLRLSGRFDKAGEFKEQSIIEIVDLTAEGYPVIRELSELPPTIRTFAIDQKGHRLAATFGYETEVRCWDSATWKEQKLPEEDRKAHADWRHTGATSFAFSLDGKRLAASTIIYVKPRAAHSSTAVYVRVWDLVDGSGPRTKILMPAQEDGFSRKVHSGVQFDSTGESLAVAHCRHDEHGSNYVDSTVHLLSLDRWEAASTVHSDQFRLTTRPSFSPDGELLAAGGVLRGEGNRNAAACVFLWDIASGQERAHFILPRSTLPPGGPREGVIFWYRRTIDQVSFDSDGGLTAETAEGKFSWPLRALDPATLSLPDNNLAVLAAHPDGTLIATGRQDTVELREFPSGRLKRELKGHKDQVTCVAFSADGSRLSSGGKDQCVIVWDTATGAEVERLPGQEKPLNHLSFTPEGKVAVNTAFSQDGKKSYAFGWPKRFTISERATGKEDLRLSPYPVGTRCAVLNADTTMAFLGTTDGKLHCIDLGSPSEPFTMAIHRGGVLALALTHGGKTLVTAGKDGLVKFWNVAPSRRLATFAPDHLNQSDHHLPVFSPDGRWVIWKGEVREVEHWSRGSLPMAYGTSMKFSSDSCWLLMHREHDPGIISEVDYPVAVIWNLRTRTKVFEFTPREAMRTYKIRKSDRIWAYGAFTPDSRYVAVSFPGNTKLFSLANGKLELAPVSSSYSLPRVLEDGKKLAVFGKNTELVDAASGKVLAEAPPGYNQFGDNTFDSHFGLGGATMVTLKRFHEKTPKTWQFQFWSEKTGIRETDFPGSDAGDAGDVREQYILPPLLADGESFNFFVLESKRDPNVKVKQRIEQWNIRTGEKKTLIPNIDPSRSNRHYCLASPGGNLLVLGEFGPLLEDFDRDAWPRRELKRKAAVLRVFDSLSGKLRATVDVPFFDARGRRRSRPPLAFGPDEKTLLLGDLPFPRPQGTRSGVSSWPIATEDSDGIMSTLLDLEKHQPVDIPAGQLLTHLLHPDGRTLILFDEELHSTITLWDRIESKEWASLAHPAPVAHVGISSDGNRLITETIDGRVWVWDSSPSGKKHAK